MIAMDSLRSGEQHQKPVPRRIQRIDWDQSIGKLANLTVWIRSMAKLYGRSIDADWHGLIDTKDVSLVGN